MKEEEEEEQEEEEGGGGPEEVKESAVPAEYCWRGRGNGCPDSCVLLRRLLAVNYAINYAFYPSFFPFAELSFRSTDIFLREKICPAVVFRLRLK